MPRKLITMIISIKVIEILTNESRNVANDASTFPLYEYLVYDRSEPAHYPAAYVEYHASYGNTHYRIERTAYGHIDYLFASHTFYRLQKFPESGFMQRIGHFGSGLHDDV